MANTEARAFLIVLDSAGVGELPDAHKYGDEGSNTIGNTARVMGGLKMPNMQKLGLGNLTDIKGIDPVEAPQAVICKAKEVGVQKDTVGGHWELMGFPIMKAFATYPNGFSESLHERFVEVMGTDWLGGYPASGTVIIEELGQKHLESKLPICYTSGDSVFQIACHHDVMSEDELHSFCKKVREEVCIGEDAVARVIARPFVGSKGNFVRTGGRKDFALAPQRDTLLDVLTREGVECRGIGKIGDVFTLRALIKSPHTDNNEQGMKLIAEALKKPDLKGFVFANLNDFDMLWGHRNNPEGYAHGLEEFDKFLPQVLEGLREGDLLIICADHGCDPTDISTDHTREYIPVISLIKGSHASAHLEDLDTFASVGATIAEHFGVSCPGDGTSFYEALL